MRSLIALLFVTGVAFADCPQFYPSKVTAKEAVVELCYDNFAVLYSMNKKVALLSSAYMDHRSGISTARRSDDFHSDRNIPAMSRAEVDDYKNSGYDRGHLTPDRDFPESKHTDVLTNIVPQVPALNRGKWSRLEADIRRQAQKEPLYVMTGTIFVDPVKTIGNRVAVPSHMYKIVVRPNKQADVYVARNENNAMIERWSIDRLRTYSNLNYNIR